MKPLPNRKTRLVPAVIAGGFLSLILLMTGCATAVGGDQSLKVVQMNVGWQMQGYRQAGIQGQFTQNQQQRVADAYAAYEAAFQQALAAANGQLETPAPASVRQAADHLFSVLGSL